MYLAEFLTVALIHLLAVASPGPDFAVVVRESVTHAVAPEPGPHWGWARRFSCTWAIRCWDRLDRVQSIVLFNALKWAAAAYLLYIGFKALRAQPAKPAAEGDCTAKWASALRAGRLPQASSPTA
jgi:threonine/homoserine/homoserine lactone efflux protein